MHLSPLDKKFSLFNPCAGNYWIYRLVYVYHYITKYCCIAFFPTVMSSNTPTAPNTTGNIEMHNVNYCQLKRCMRGLDRQRLGGSSFICAGCSNCHHHHSDSHHCSPLHFAQKTCQQDDHVSGIYITCLDLFVSLFMIWHGYLFLCL